MTLGVADHQGDLFDEVVGFCEGSLPESSIYRFLGRERDRLFPDAMFVDLFDVRGRRSVPPSVVATVMVLQRLEGLSDREAVERYAFDVRWRYAAGVGGYGGGGWVRFAHTVLVDMRERLRCSKRPNRVFEVALDAACEAGLVGRRRVLDSTPLYDAVATMDTVTLIRSAVRGLLGVVDGAVEAELRAVLGSGDDYADAGKPRIDWDDRAAREQLVDSRARDGFAVLAVLDGRKLSDVVGQAAALPATVLGQDLETGTDGVLRIARRVAKDRVISTVDPQARHGHKTAARGFDGYKGHVAIDPDSEVITATTVTPGNTGDAGAATDLIADLLPDAGPTVDEPGGSATADEPGAEAATESDAEDIAAEPGAEAVTDEGRPAGRGAGGDPATAEPGAEATAEPGAEATAEPGAEDIAAEPGAEAARVYGDNAYGTGEFHDRLDQAGIASKCKTQTPTAPGGRFSKDHFAIDLGAGTVGCPAGFTAPIRPASDGGGLAGFGPACARCPLRAQCTTATNGRTISIGPYEQTLTDARTRQADPDWVADYRATRPKVERKIGHLMRRKHGGRRARVRGTVKIDADFRLLAAAANLARLATLGLRFTPTGWTATA